jgi:hypothetical protein
MELFERLDYLPPTISTLECAAFIGRQPLEVRQKYKYTLAPAFGSDLLAGLDYTSDATAYASEFRPSTPEVNFPGRTGLIANAGTQLLSANDFTQNLAAGGPGSGISTAGNSSLCTEFCIIVVCQIIVGFLFSRI